MFNLTLARTLIVTQSPILLHELSQALMIVVNLVWINHSAHYLPVVAGTAFGSSIIVVLKVLIIAMTRPLREIGFTVLKSEFHIDLSHFGTAFGQSLIVSNFLYFAFALILLNIRQIAQTLGFPVAANSAVLNVISQYLHIALITVYALLIYENIHSFLGPQNLIKYGLSAVVIFGIFAQYLSLLLFDNDDTASYLDMVASLSIGFSVCSCLMVLILLIFMCGGAQSFTRRLKLGSCGTEENHLLIGRDLSIRRDPPSIYSKGSIHQIHHESYDTFNGNKVPSVHSSVASPIVDNPWFHLPTCRAQSISMEMLNPLGLLQLVTSFIKYLVVQFSEFVFIYSIIVLVPSSISMSSLVASALAFHGVIFLMVIPRSLSQAVHRLIISAFDHPFSHQRISPMVCNDLWDTAITIWLLTSCCLTVIIYLLSDQLVALFLPYRPQYDDVYRQLLSCYIPWSILFVILYGICQINLGVHQCLNSELNVYSLRNSATFLVPLCYWLLSIANGKAISLNVLWLSLCICCTIIGSFAMYRRCTIDWQIEHQQYLQRKMRRQQHYKYQRNRQMTWSVRMCCNCCCKRRAHKIHGVGAEDISPIYFQHDSDSMSSNLSHQSIDEHNQLWNDAVVVPGPQQKNKVSKANKLKRKRGVNSRCYKKRHLVDLKSWSSLEGNPYYQSSDYHGDGASNATLTDQDDTLILKTESDDTTHHASTIRHSFGDDTDHQYEALEQYVDGLDALDDEDEDTSSENQHSIRRNQPIPPLLAKFSFHENLLAGRGQKYGDGFSFNDAGNEEESGDNLDGHIASKYKITSGTLTSFDSLEAQRLNAQRRQSPEMIND